MKNKQGISLIVLVITIIVMIILVSAVVITLSNNGIINRADEAVDKTNKSQIEHLAALAWADAYADGLRGAELKAKVEEILESNKITTDDWNIAVTDKGVTVKPRGEEVKLGELVTSTADFGKYVIYEANGVSEWQVFYKDETTGYVYLISKDVLENASISTSINVNSLTEDDLALYELFQVGEWPDHVLIDNDQYGTYMYSNKCVATLIKNYQTYANVEEYGEHIKGSIGGPTIRLFATSWNAAQKTPELVLEANDWGYQINGLWNVNLTMEPMYFIEGKNYWIASPNYAYQNLNLEVKAGEVRRYDWYRYSMVLS